MTNMEKIQICQKVVDRIQLESRRPVCRIGLSRKPFAITDSHLGGVPYVPREGRIPTDQDGNQLWLCAQMNLAQMPHLDGFPETGILQIFLSDWGIDDFGLCSENTGDGTPQDGWKAVYYPEIDGTVTMEECAAKMAVPWAEANKKNMPRPAHRIDLEEIERGETDLWRCPNVPLKMTFGPAEKEGVSMDDIRFYPLFDAALRELHPGADPKEFRPYDIWDQTEEEREALNQVRTQSKNGGCKIGGYPLYLQCDPRENPYEGMSEAAMAKYGVTAQEAEAARALAAWDTLLFQLDGDTFRYPVGAIEEADLDLNGGTLNVLIRSEDLRRGDFSRLIAQWSCT